MIRLFSILLIAVMLVSSCKNPDESAPVIEYVHANDLPADFIHAIAGRTNSFQVKMSDDKELFQAKLEMITTAGIHQHESTDGEPVHAFMDFNMGEWDTLSIANVSGKEHIEEFFFMVPETVSGSWSASVSVLDKNGNMTTNDYVVHIQNDSIPVISVGTVSPEPDANGLIHIAEGNSLVLSGYVIDPDSITYVKAVLTHGNDEAWTEQWDGVNNWTFNLENIQVPVFNDSGNFILTIYTEDTHGWTNHSQARIVVE